MEKTWEGTESSHALREGGRTVEAMWRDLSALQVTSDPVTPLKESSLQI